MAACLSRVNELLDPILQKPEEFYVALKPRAEVLTQVAKLLFDFAHTAGSHGPLNQLIVKNFDVEQIWEQLRLQNEPTLAFCERELTALGGLEEKKASAGEESQSEDANEASASEGENAEEEEEVPLADEGPVSAKPCPAPPVKSRAEIAAELNDGFFDLDEMEQFVQQAEEEAARQARGESVEEEEDEEEIDWSAPLDTEGESATYNEFFAPPVFKEKAEGERSGFDEEQERLRETIEEFEEGILKPRPWDQQGEVTARDRPENSLLETAVEFDFAGKLAPVITAESTAELETLIKRRVADEAWDDVEPRTVKKLKKKPDEVTVSAEKDKQGLAELYEKDFLSQAVSGTTAEEGGGVLEPQHVEIAKLFASLCYKLDALSNFHFTPRPPTEPERIKSVPAVILEEVVPLAVSSAQTRAVGEVFQSRAAGDKKGETEESRTDKKRRRRKAKGAGRRKRKREDEQNSEHAADRKALETARRVAVKGRGEGGRGAKRSGKRKGSEAFKSSKKFFSEMQANAATDAAGKKGSKKRKLAAEPVLSAKKFKL